MRDTRIQLGVSNRRQFDKAVCEKRVQFPIVARHFADKKRDMTRKPDCLALLKRGLEYQRGGKDDAAGALYAQVLRSDPRNPDALNLLGVLDLNHGRLAAAGDKIAKAIRIFAKDGLLS